MIRSLFIGNLRILETVLDPALLGKNQGVRWVVWAASREAENMQMIIVPSINNSIVLALSNYFIMKAGWQMIRQTADEIKFVAC